MVVGEESECNPYTIAWIARGEEAVTPKKRHHPFSSLLLLQETLAEVTRKLKTTQHYWKPLLAWGRTMDCEHAYLNLPILAEPSKESLAVSMALMAFNDLTGRGAELWDH